MKNLLISSLFLFFTFIYGCSNKEVTYRYPSKQLGDTQPYWSDQDRQTLLTTKQKTLFNSSIKAPFTQNKSEQDLFWKAALEALSAMPLEKIDESSGLITTEWYIDQTNPHEKFKANVLVRANTFPDQPLKITVFQKNLKKGQWYDSCTNTAMPAKIETDILTIKKRLEEHGS